MRLVSLNAFDRLFGRQRLIELQVGVTDGKRAAGGGKSGIHHQEPRPTPRSGLTHQACELEVLAVEIKGSFCGPNPPDNVPPFLAKDVTVIVFELAHSEHVELIDIPAADDIKGETALPNMVGRDHLLGRQDRMKKRHMECAEDSYVVGLGE